MKTFKRLTALLLSLLLVIGITPITAFAAGDDVEVDLGGIVLPFNPENNLETAYNNTAAIRTAENSTTGKNGLRIYNMVSFSFINKYSIVEYGTIATLKGLVTGDFTLENTEIPKVRGVAFNSEKDIIWDKTDTYKVFTAYLTNIPESKLGEDYVLRTYAKDSSGKTYYGESYEISAFDVAFAIDNGDAVGVQTQTDIDAFYAFTKDSETGSFDNYDKWLKENLKLPGALRNKAKVEDTLSGAELTAALKDGYYEPLFERAIANEGNKALLKALYEKAEAGEDISIVGLGGSITQKAACTDVKNSYSYLVYEWLQAKFPNITVNYKNAGIGATTSVLGISRLTDQVLAYNPDIVIVDFTTNDSAANAYCAGSYEAILRTLISKNVATLSVIFGNVNNAQYQQGTSIKGSNCESLHAAPMLYTDVPVIDYYGVMWDCYLDSNNDGESDSNDAIAWTDLWGDYIHPNEAGHKLVANAINYYLGKVYDEYKAGTINDVAGIPELTLDEYTNNFLGAQMYGNTNIGAMLTSIEGVTNGAYTNFDSTTTSNWETWIISEGGHIEFTIEKAKFFALMRVVSPTGGKADIYVNNKKVATENTYNEKYPRGANFQGTIKFYDGSETIKVKIVATEGTYTLTTILTAQDK